MITWTFGGFRVRGVVLSPLSSGFVKGGRGGGVRSDLVRGVVMVMVVLIGDWLLAGGFRGELQAIQLVVTISCDDDNG